MSEEIVVGRCQGGYEKMVWPPAQSQEKMQGRINHGAKRAMAQGPPP